MAINQRKTRKRRKQVSNRNLASRYKMLGYLLFYGATVTLLTMAVVWGYRTIMSHPSFAVKKIEILGASPNTRQDISNTFSNHMNMNIFKIEPKTMRDSILVHPWVASADVFTQLPDTIRIQVTERLPGGMIRRGNDLFLIGNEGEIICSYHEYGKPVDLPVLIGLEKNADNQAAIRLGLKTLTNIKDASLVFWDNIETLDLSDNDNMVVRLRNERAPVHLGGQVIAANLKNYLSIAQHIQETYPALDYIELGFPEQIAIMPKK